MPLVAMWIVTSSVSGACGVISFLTSQGGGGPVAERVVRVDASPRVLRALTGAADGARRWLGSLRLVHP